jgi:hypothetical protein
MNYYQKYSEKELIGRGNFGIAHLTQVKSTSYTAIKHLKCLWLKRYLLKVYLKNKSKEQCAKSKSIKIYTMII